MSLTTLVIVEILNSVNALSDEKSLLKIGVMINPLLIAAIVISSALHLVILYVPFFAEIFGTTYLTLNDWLLILALSFPIILLDEMIKYFYR